MGGSSELAKMTPFNPCLEVQFESSSSCVEIELELTRGEQVGPRVWLENCRDIGLITSLLAVSRVPDVVPALASSSSRVVWRVMGGRDRRGGTGRLREPVEIIEPEESNESWRT